MNSTMLTQLSELFLVNLQTESLFEQAFTHKSFLNEHPQETCNERLEFLGDAVLELVVTEFLYQEYPQKPEGELTSFRSALVRGKHLAEIAKELDLGKYLRLSRGEEKSGGRKKSYILANTFEAIIGAIYLDLNLDAAKKFIYAFVIPRLTHLVESGQHRDAKSEFQELTQEKIGVTPHYKLVSESGPDHNKSFCMGVFLEEGCIAEGKGSSKQKAELAAAEQALQVWKG